MDDRNPRQRFLEMIGLSHDPFARPVAEQELNSREQQAYFYQYFVPVSSFPTEGQTVFQDLRAARHSFIYGDPGSGKTALRIALELNTRTVRDRTLAVTYTLGDIRAHEFTAAEHWPRLARSIAIDLLPQIIEQFNPNELEPTPDHLAALQRQARLGSRPLRRLLEEMLEELELKAPHRADSRRRGEGKLALPYTSPGDALELLNLCLQSSKSSKPDPIGRQAIEESVRTARLWGFEHVLVLVDDLDIHGRSVDDMVSLMMPLIESLPDWSARAVFFKCFLPNTIQPKLSARLSAIGLHPPVFEARISWDDDALRQLLAQRFRTSGSRHTHLDMLAGPELKGQLEALVLNEAAGSPRRLLQVINELIDIHSSSATQQPRLSLQDWQNLRSTGSSTPLAPATPTPDGPDQPAGGAMTDWQAYHSIVFVGREQILARLLAWADDAAPGRRVLSLVAPPGSGKTWVLRAASGLWKSGAPARPTEAGRLTIWIDVPALFREGKLDHDAIRAMLKEAHRDAVKLCENIRPIDSHHSITTIIDTLVDDLCGRCHMRAAPLIIVDCYDEVPPEQALEFDQQVLEGFISRACIQLVISRRDEYALKSDILRQHEQLMTLDDPELAGGTLAHEHFRRFAQTYYPNVSIDAHQIDEWRRSAPTYKWNHPYLNAYLFNHALARADAEGLRPLNADDLLACCLAVIERPLANGQTRYPNVDSILVETLTRIAHKLSVQWIEEDLEDQLDLRLIDDQIEQLFAHGVITNISDQGRPTPRYGISAPLRDLLLGVGEPVERRSRL
jgi:hypothetical protein